MNSINQINKSKLPVFIVFEGIDGSGKSTQSELLFNYLISNNIDSKLMMEPTNGKWGIKIREILKGNSFPDAEDLLKLFILDRHDDVKTNILPCLKNRQSVIMDRYYYSNAAYQGAMGLSAERILKDKLKREERRKQLRDERKEMH